MKVSVLGAGAWGTALARLLHDAGHPVTLWGHDARHLDDLRSTNCNKRYLPGIALPATMRLDPDLASAKNDADVVVLAVPSKAFRRTAAELTSFQGLIVSVTKGIEYETGLTMSGVLRQVAPKAKCVALSGPTLAMEVAQGVPTAAVVAGTEPQAAKVAQQLFHRPSFRVYTSADVLGVELGGALKNVVAIAAGTSDGLGFGDNAKAALITRGIVETQRLGEACGAQAQTFAGLSGLGDLVVTCFSKLSRNRAFGERLGRGENPQAILDSSVSVAEGVPTARSSVALARRLGVEVPIMTEVHAMLYEGKSAARAMKELMGRESKPESH